MGRKIGRLLRVVVPTILLILLLLFVLTSSLNRRADRPTFLFGHALFWVETGSMEPSIPAKSYILVKSSDGEDIAEGAVITYICRDSASPVFGRMVTHRVVEVTSEGYRTKGDASAPDTVLVSAEDVVAVYVRGLPLMTVAGRVLASPVGLLLILAVFLGSCAFIYIPDLVRGIRGERVTDEVREREIAARVQEEVQKMMEREDREE